ncbi:MAG: hypothetical protein EPN74_08330 [Rhodanobacter sp.]|nr:MAG: hypothetical protein EPN74_08330 [Rhodanobacter sp.]
MEFVVVYPAFKRQQLMIRAAGFFRRSEVLLNGITVQRVKGKYPVRNDEQAMVAVQLRSRFFDAIPAVRIGNATVDLVAPLRWYEQLWVGLPILLLFVGGTLGAGIGSFAALVNSRIFRDERHIDFRYLLAGLVTLAAGVSFVVLAVAIRLAFKPTPN